MRVHHSHRRSRQILHTAIACAAAIATTNDYLTVILPEFVPARWWQHVFHNQTSLLIKGALLFRPNVVVTTVPYLVGHAVRLSDVAHFDETLSR